MERHGVGAVSHSASHSAQRPEEPLNPLRRARMAAGLSQERLAALAGVSQDTVYRAEREERTPRLASMQALARALGVRAEDVFPVDLQVRPVNPTRAMWPPPPDDLNLAVQAYRAAGDALGASELLGIHQNTVRERLNLAGCRERPRGGSRADGVQSLAAWARKVGVDIAEAVDAAQAGRVPGAFLQDLDDPVLGVRWCVRG